MKRSKVFGRFPVKFLYAAAMVVAVLVVVVGCTSETPELAATAEPTAAPTSTPKPTATPRPTLTPVPTPTPTPNPPPIIFTPGNNSYEQGESITAFTIVVTDAEDVPTVTLSGLPSGLSYISGQVRGTVASNANAKDYTVTISADDGSNPAVTATFTVTVTLNTPPVITNPDNKSYEQGELISAFGITVNDAEETPTVAVSGLPPGLSYISGQVRGTVASNANAKDYTVTISADDGSNPAVTATFIVTVTLNTPPVITNPDNKSYEQGELISAFGITVNDAEETPTVAVSGLPPGLSYISGQVRGTVASNANAKDYTVTISADDGSNPAVTATFIVTVTLNTPPVITNPDNKSYDRGESIARFNITVNDAEDTPAVGLSGLPSGLSYGSGAVSGTVSIDATTKDYEVTITADDGVNAVVSATFTIAVLNAAPVITNPGDKSYERGESITKFNITVTDADDTSRVTLSGLPSGLSYKSGEVSGKVASSPQDYVVTIYADDRVNPVVSTTFTITVTPRTWPVDDLEGDWQVSFSTDGLTDWEKVQAWILPRGSTRQSGEFLIVRCGYNRGGYAEAEVVVDFGNKLAEEGPLEIQYRFDDGPVETEEWSLSSDDEALFAQSPVEFIWQMMQSQELVIRQRGIQGIQTLIFDVEGLSNALYSHREKCEWI